MATSPMPSIIHYVRRLAGSPCLEDLTDRQLLERFAYRHDQQAFEVLVRRHGRLVRATCQRVLRDADDVDDAFQATFLILARKAGSLRWSDAIGSWLYAVAHRVALKARTRRARRQKYESQAGQAQSSRNESSGWQELQEVLDEELAALPEKYRQPLLLCGLEGLAREEAAERLGCSLGVIKGRLERGRELLRARLTRRGVMPSAAFLAVLLTKKAEASVPASLVAGAVQAALGGGVPGSVLTLTKEVLKAMFLSKLKWMAAVLVVGVLGLGAGTVALQAQGDKPGVEGEKPAVEGEKPADKRDRPARDGEVPKRKKGRGDRDVRRDGDAPREGENRVTLCVVPLSKTPDSETLTTLGKVFGEDMTITIDKDLKVAVLRGRESLLAGAIQGLRDAIDKTTARPRDGDREGDLGSASQAIDLVRLRKADPAAVSRLIKKYVSDKLEITEKAKARALLIEGERSAVYQASALARQIDGQMMHPALRRILIPREGDRERERDRDRERERDRD